MEALQKSTSPPILPSVIRCSWMVGLNPPALPLLMPVNRRTPIRIEEGSSETYTLLLQDYFWRQYFEVLDSMISIEGLFNLQRGMPVTAVIERVLINIANEKVKVSLT